MRPGGVQDIAPPGSRLIRRRWEPLPTVTLHVPYSTVFWKRLRNCCTNARGMAPTRSACSPAPAPASSDRRRCRPHQTTSKSRRRVFSHLATGSNHEWNPSAWPFCVSPTSAVCCSWHNQTFLDRSTSCGHAPACNRAWPSASYTCTLPRGPLCAQVLVVNVYTE